MRQGDFGSGVFVVAVDGVVTKWHFFSAEKNRPMKFDWIVDCKQMIVCWMMLRAVEGGADIRSIR